MEIIAHTVFERTQPHITLREALERHKHGLGNARALLAFNRYSSKWPRTVVGVDMNALFQGLFSMPQGHARVVCNENASRNLVKFFQATNMLIRRRPDLIRQHHLSSLMSSIINLHPSTLHQQVSLMTSIHWIGKKAPHLFDEDTNVACRIMERKQMGLRIGQTS